MFNIQSVEKAIKLYSHSEDYYWWKDNNDTYRMMNDKMAKYFGHDSTSISFEGITDYDHKCKTVEIADEFIKNDRLVITEKNPLLC